MTPWPSRISLGDLIAAAKRLEADAETTRSIAELLDIVARRATGPARRRARRGEVPGPDRQIAPGRRPSKPRRPRRRRPVIPTATRRVVASTLTPVRSPAFAGVQALPLAGAGVGQEVRAYSTDRFLQEGYAQTQC